jgi:hypothetical protein
MAITDDLRNIIIPAIVAPSSNRLDLGDGFEEVADVIEKVLTDEGPLVWQSYTPTYGSVGAGTSYTSVATFRANYTQIGKLLVLNVRTTAGDVTGSPTHLTVSTPVAVSDALSGGVPQFAAVFVPSENWGFVGCYGANAVSVTAEGGAAWSAGNRALGFNIVLAAA